MNIVFLFCIVWSLLIFRFVSEPFLSSGPSSQKKSHFFFWTTLIFIFLLLFTFPISYGEERFSGQSLASAQISVPSGFIETIGTEKYLLPSVHQFVLMPMEGNLTVYYVGLFSYSPRDTKRPILLPFPRNSQNLDLLDFAAVDQKKKPFFVTKSTLPILLSFPLKEGVNQIRVSFSLDAFWGTASWNPALSTLPGVSLFLIPFYGNGLSDFFSFLPSWLNIWPPRLSSELSGYRSLLTTDPLVSKENLLSQKVKQYIRVNFNEISAPQFEVIGLVPNSLSLLLVCVFSLFLFATGPLVIFLIRLVRKKFQ